MESKELKEALVSITKDLEKIPRWLFKLYLYKYKIFPTGWGKAFYYAKTQKMYPSFFKRFFM